MHQTFWGDFFNFSGNQAHETIFDCADCGQSPSISRERPEDVLALWCKGWMCCDSSHECMANRKIFGSDQGLKS
eukprot:2515387-Amphidinium_carterae.1